MWPESAEVVVFTAFALAFALTFAPAPTRTGASFRKLQRKRGVHGRAAREPQAPHDQE